jgi:hypothetical protein
MRIQEVVEQSYQLDESITSKIDDWIEDNLRKLFGEPKDYDKMTPWMSDKIEKSMKSAPTEPVPREVIEKILANKKIQQELERAAQAQRTTVEKIKPYLMYFVNKFIERWRRIPARDRQNFWKDLLMAVFRLIMFILQILAKSKR